MPLKHKYRISVDYGLDVHSVTTTKAVMEKISSGSPIIIVGQGFSIEGEASKDVWSFHCTAPGSLEIECNDGHQIFIGALKSAIITELSK